MISSDTRRKLDHYDGRERELTERYGKARWAAWHGRGPNSSIMESAEVLHSLPKQLDYCKTLRSAATEAGSHMERREVELRLSEALYNRIVRDPRVATESARATAEYGAFRYSFDRSTLTSQEMVQAWQSMSGTDPFLSETIYSTYLNQSARLQGIIIGVVNAMNQVSMAAGSELGLDVHSFADVILMRNEVSEPEFLGFMDGIVGQMASTGFRDVLIGTFQTEPTVLNDLMLVNAFLQESCFTNAFPANASGAGAYLKHILRLSGFDAGLINQLGATPYSLDLALDEFAEGNEGALWLGKGTREYLVGVNPALHQDPRQYLQALFHECGHMLHYDGMNSIARPAFFKGDTEAFREAMALSTDRLISERDAVTALGIPEEAIDLVSCISKFLDAARAREFAIRALLEFNLYSGTEAHDISMLYGKLLRNNPIGAPLSGITLAFQGQSWGAESGLAIRPGASMEYGLAFAFSDSVMAGLQAAGYGSAVHESTAGLLQAYCYGGLESPPTMRLESLLQSTGMKRTPTMQ
ncbi:hypothetical protein H0O00_05215 [Candidatus Micrarchaeota archaeon]|nr:hypothetical protein [Candidatus Micrarchaeota archaeon]